jgi:hypothetical protein
MKFRILPNLLEVMIKNHYDFAGIEDLLPNQVLKVDGWLESILRLDVEKVRAGTVDSEIITGKFVIPIECLDRISPRG